MALADKVQTTKVLPTNSELEKAGNKHIIETVLKKGNATMKKEIKVQGNVFEDNTTSNMVRFFSSRMKMVIVQDAINTIKNAIGVNFEHIFSSEDVKFLDSQFDILIQSALNKLQGKKTPEYGIEELERYLTTEEIEGIKERFDKENREYSFEELKEYIVYGFQDVTVNMVGIFKSINIR